MVALLAGAGVGIVPQAGNTSLCGASVPDASGTPGHRERLAHEPRARHRPREQHDHRRGRLRPRGAAARGGRERPLLPAVAGRGGQLRGGRQHLHQRRRHAGAALRQHARAGAGAGSGAARRPRVGRPARAAQGQHRLRPEAPLHRRRRHARHRHRGRAQALPEAARHRDRARGRRRPRRRRRPARHGCARACGERVTGFELIARVCLDLVLQAHPGPPRPASPQPIPWYVLVELFDSTAGRALAQLLEDALGEAAEEGLVHGRGDRRERGAAPGALGAAREHLRRAEGGGRVA